MMVVTVPAATAKMVLHAVMETATAFPIAKGSNVVMTAATARAESVAKASPAWKKPASNVLLIAMESSVVMMVAMVHVANVKMALNVWQDSASAFRSATESSVVTMAVRAHVASAKTGIPASMVSVTAPSIAPASPVEMTAAAVPVASASLDLSAMKPVNVFRKPAEVTTSSLMPQIRIRSQPMTRSHPVKSLNPGLPGARRHPVRPPWQAFSSC
jgi:hypothetical protein